MTVMIWQWSDSSCGSLSWFPCTDEASVWSFPCFLIFTQTWVCSRSFQNSLVVKLSNKVLLNPKREQIFLKKPIRLFYLYLKPISPFLVSSQGSCWLQWRAIASNISVDVLCVPPSLSQALFTLLLGLPFSQTKYGRLIYREEKHDRSPPSASLSLSFQISASPLLSLLISQRILFINFKLCSIITSSSV